MGKKKSFILILLLVIAAIACYPILFLITGSFMSPDELKQNLGPITADTSNYSKWQLIPIYPTAKAYVELLLDSPKFFLTFWNSTKITLGILLGQLLVAVPAAWGFSKYKFRFKKVIFTIYIILMMMPFQVTMLSSFLVLDNMHLMDTHWAVILPGVFSTFPVFIMCNFFQGIPDALIESAKIDGANSYEIFRHIAMPLGSSGIISIMVLGFLENWNLIEQPLTFLKDKTLWPLSLFLPNISLENAGIAFASSVITLIPAILVFIGGQDYLEQGIMATAIKE
jgi:multiple sugar transport system permease protein